jgi:FtsP/CotA-like multicopper oxidase with cupredoxin domain
VPKTYRLAPGDPLMIGPGQRMDVMVQAPSTPGTYLLQATDNNSGEIKSSVSPYRDSNFPNGITPAAQPSRHSFDFPSPCPGPGAPSASCVPPNAPPGIFKYPITLATIVVSGATKSMNLPADPLPTPNGLPSIATMLSVTPAKVRNIVFELCGGVTGTVPNPPLSDGTLGNFKNLNVNLPSCYWYFQKYNAMYWGGTPFTTLLMMRDADDVGECVASGCAQRINFKKDGLFNANEPLFPDMIAGNYEEWTVYNRSFSTHPWHLHQNHVLITKINGVTLPQPEWHDTLLVPAASAPCSATSGGGAQRRRAGAATAQPVSPVQPADPTNTCLGPQPTSSPLPNQNINVATPGSITFRVYFNPVTVGCFVAHCHVIDHEDLGMMQRMDILPAPGQSSGCTLDVAAATPNLQKLLAMKDSFALCLGSAPALSSRKQSFSSPKQASSDWTRPNLR